MATAIGVRSMISKHITNNFCPSVTAIVFSAVRTLPNKNWSRRSFILEHNDLELSFNVICFITVLYNRGISSC